MGSASRDFNVVFPTTRIFAAFATQFPGIENRVYAIAGGLLLCCSPLARKAKVHS